MVKFYKLLKDKFKILLVPVCFIFLQTEFVFSQDIHFSQYFSTPLAINPANTGNFDGNWRLMNTYRTQWKVLSIPYETFAAGFDKHFYIFSEQISAGLFYIHDKSGSIGLTADKLYFSIAYSRQIKSNNISFGIQPGVVRKYFDMRSILFPDQFSWNTGGYDPNISNGETNLNDKTTYFDLNIGIRWFKKFNKIKPEAGLAFYHLNKPRESFGTIDLYKLPIRSVLHLSTEFRFDNSFFFELQTLYMNHKVATEFLPGFNIGIKTDKTERKIKSVFAGGYYRGGFNQYDAIVAVFGINYKQTRIGLSYDINISELQAHTDKRGAFEISLIYCGLNTIPSKVYVPCDIY